MWLSRPASESTPSVIARPAVKDDRRAPASGALVSLWTVTTTALMMLSTLMLSTTASAQSIGADASTMPDPARCIAVLDDSGGVGLRIADAQSIHEAVLSNLRKRLGTDAIIYEGTRKNAAKMKAMLGKGSETQIQDAQLAYFDACIKASAFRVRARFGQKKSEHFITLSCRKATAKETEHLEEKRFTGKSFMAAKDQMIQGLDQFCQVLPTATSLIPNEAAAPKQPGEIPGLRKKQIKEWTPPPKRD
jgi:hypothetical protein